MSKRKRITKPRQAMSPRALDRAQLLLRRQSYHLACAIAANRELYASVIRAEKR